MEWCGIDYWNYELVARLNSSPAQLVVVPDIRTVDEVRLIRSLGGTVAVVRRDSVAASDNPLEGLLANTDFDVELDNNRDDQGHSMFQQLDSLAAHTWSLCDS